jgi:hypothetical protein
MRRSKEGESGGSVGGIQMFFVGVEDVYCSDILHTVPAFPYGKGSI